MDLTPFFQSAVVKLNRNQTATLGDRTEYIGSSDVAGCIRKAHPIPATETIRKRATVFSRNPLF